MTLERLAGVTSSNWARRDDGRGAPENFVHFAGEIAGGRERKLSGTHEAVGGGWQER